MAPLNSKEQARPAGCITFRSLFPEGIRALDQPAEAAYNMAMNPEEVCARLKSIEPALRARGVGASYLFGSHGRGQAGPESDINLFVDAGRDDFYDLGNFMGAYQDLQSVFPDAQIGYSTREGLYKYVRPIVEEEAIRVF